MVGVMAFIKSLPTEWKSALGHGCRGEIEKIDDNGGGIGTLVINAVLRWA
jgi:hypothetical protein